MNPRSRAKWLSGLFATAGLLLAAGCDDADIPVEPDATVAADVPMAPPGTPTAWVPGTPEPGPPPADHHHAPPVVDWIPYASFDAMVDESKLIVRGRVESVRHDVLRAYAQDKSGGPPVRDELGRRMYDDLPITIATVRMDDILRAAEGVQTPRGTSVTEGDTIDVVFTGGLLSCGCTNAQEESPLPTVGEEAVYFLEELGGDGPLGTGSTVGLYSARPQGRVAVQDDRTFPLLASEIEDTVEMSRFDDRPVSDLVAAVAGQPPSSLVAEVPASDATDSICYSYLSPRTNGAIRHWCHTTLVFWDRSGVRWPVWTAANLWEDAMPFNTLRLTYYAGSTQPANMDVYFVSMRYGLTGWAGKTDYIGETNDDSADSNGCFRRHIVVRYNESYPKTGSPSERDDKANTIHEMGHSLGLGHSSCTNSMYNTNDNCQASFVSTCDAQGARSLYH